MKKNTIIAIATPLLIMVFFSGCASSKQPEAKKIIKNTQMEIGVPMHDPYKYRLKPIIGSRNNDARTIVDNGVPLKIWISPYKTREGVLIASHDIYIWGKRPDFITGEELPVGFKKNRGLNYRDKVPFTLSPEEMDRADIKNDENIQTFIENLPTKESVKITKATPKLQEIDSKLLEFMKNRKQIKEQKDKK